MAGQAASGRWAARDRRLNLDDLRRDADSPELLAHLDDREQSIGIALLAEIMLALLRKEIFGPRTPDRGKR